MLCMKRFSCLLRVALLSLPIVVTGLLADASEPPPSRSQVEAMMGLRSEGDLVRGQLDTVGFVVTAEQADDLLRVAVEQEQSAIESRSEQLGLGKKGLVGGICPHDDHLYSARVTVHLSERITAPVVVLIGVFHKARLWDLEGKLVLDRFQAWHGPWGPVPVSDLREELLAALPCDQVVVDNTMHCREHSLESLLPFLQHRNRQVEIVPVLVPYLSWRQLETLSDALAHALSDALDRRGWQLGRDLAIVISNDSVHYGADFDHAPFGSDAAAYQQGVDRDLALVSEHLVGPVHSDALQAFQHTLVDQDDVRRYRIPWCGRFSVPFGLEVLRKVAAGQGLPAPEGVLLRYGTTLSEPELPVSDATRRAGLGYTARANLHHWVGFVSVGYTVPDR